MNQKEDRKQEHMTSIRGGKMVLKNHKRIVLRGEIDEFKALLLIFMAEQKQDNQLMLLEDLKELLAWVNLLQRSEVNEEEMPELSFLGLDSQGIREHSHDPQKHYGVGHLFGLDYTADMKLLKLNEIRAKARKLEIVALNAYFIDGKTIRKDMLEAFNRLSSGVYIIAIKTLAGNYTTKFI